MKTSWLVGMSVVLALSLGLAARVDAQRPGPAGSQGLAAKLDALQAQVSSLQAQVDELVAGGAPDDGTAAALVGTWTGPARSVEFVRPVKLSGSPPQVQFEPFFNVGDSTQGTTTPQYSFLVPILGFCPESGGYCGNKTISVNPAYLLTRASNDRIR